MAENQNNNHEEPKTRYEKAEQAFGKLVSYSTVLQKIQEGKVVPDLNEIAASAAMEFEGKILKDDAKENFESNDVNQHFDYIKGAASKFSVRLTRLFEKNLEEIINTTPDKAMEGIEKRLYSFAPPEDKKVPREYKEIARLHRKIAKMRNVWEQYQKANENEKKSIREDFMEDEVKEYYIDRYKDGKNEEEREENAELLKVSLKWLARKAGLCERKYDGLLGRRTDEFKAKLLGLTYDEYKKQKDKEKDERIREGKEREREIEDEDYESEFIEEQERHRSEEKLKDKIIKEIPDYLKEVMEPEAVRNMYMSYWQEQLAKKNQNHG